MTIPINPKFAAPRSYWRGIAVGYGNPFTLSLTGNQVHAHAAGAFGVIDTYITLADNFPAWSSNRWTIDYIFTDQYTILNGSSPLVFSGLISILLNPDNAGLYAVMSFVGGDGFRYVDLPPSPTDYWLPSFYP